MDTNEAELSASPRDDFRLELFPGAVKQAMASSHAKSRDLWQVPVANIRIIDGFNVRIRDAKYDEKIDELAKSILAEGFYQDKPLAGYVAKENGENVIFVTDGHRRYEATLKAITAGAQIEVLPIVVSAQSVSTEDLVVSLVRANSGEPLRPYEQAVVAKRLQRYGWETPQIAERLGFSGQYVENLLFLMAAPIAIRNMVIEDQVSASTAVEALRTHGEKAVEKLTEALNKVQSGGQTRITKKHLINPVERAAKKHGFALYDAAKKVSEDPGLAGLKPETRELIAKIVGEIEAKGAAAAPESAQEAAE